MKYLKCILIVTLFSSLLYSCGAGSQQTNDTSYIDEINADNNAETNTSQTNPNELKGEALRKWLKKKYYNGQHKTLGYKQARRYMYNFIDNRDGQIEGVYSGYKKKWRYGGKGTNPMPINCEHTVPQSFFRKQEPMKSDLHHLFPTYAEWNRVRNNFGFAEIDDQTTTQWMRQKASKEDIPAKDIIDEYSEFTRNQFEPREAHKGNLARAVFYFFTMYPDQAGSINRVANIKTLYQWHLQDPVNEAERKRNEAIAKYQGNHNPYVDKPDLVKRAWSID
ncbi:hypothetical protein BKI52_29360 [marine bacterium AO1-C]|nr:hypothetical protein BKI52_29360 [marine bacterium AO1-C]